MGAKVAKDRLVIASLLSLLALFLALVVSPAVPNIASAAVPSLSGPCDHVLSPAANASHPTVECFLNATGAISFEPNTLNVPANATVIFSVGVQGPYSHTFALDNIANDSKMAAWTQNPSSVNPATLLSYMENHSSPFLFLNNSGQTYISSPVTLNASHGIFYFVCTVPGHFETDNMWGAVYEGIAPPLPLVTPNYTAPIQVGILIAAFALMAAAAAFIYGGQHLRFPKKKVRAPPSKPATGEPLPPKQDSPHAG